MIEEPLYENIATLVCYFELELNVSLSFYPYKLIVKCYQPMKNIPINKTNFNVMILISVWMKHPHFNSSWKIMSILHQIIWKITFLTLVEKKKKFSLPVFKLHCTFKNEWVNVYVWVEMCVWRFNQQERIHSNFIVMISCHNVPWGNISKISFMSLLVLE